MLAAFHGSYVDFVYYIGLTERYPKWFNREVLDDIYMDCNRYTFWVPLEERNVDYYEKTLVEDYSVFLRKSNGEIFCTTYDAFEGLYDIFKYNSFTNSGVAAFSDDCITYVECTPGVLLDHYPEWFYEYFTEAVNIPYEETVFTYDSDQHRLTSVSDPFIMNLNGEISVDKHCVFLKNDMGEIRHMEYDNFLKFYNTGPLGGHNFED